VCTRENVLSVNKFQGAQGKKNGRTNKSIAAVK
jgi:hypothetical protein